MNQNSIWFPEPLIDDPSWAQDQETIIDWIRRSTLPRANEIRHFLNQNIERLPLSVRVSFAHALAHRWESALFELVVARILQEWGAELENEAPNQEGRCPDFLARFSGSKVVVEATCPLYNQARDKEIADKNPLVRVIEELVPTGYCVAVLDVPHLSQSHPLHKLKRAVQSLFEPFNHLSPAQMPDEGIELETEIDEGKICIQIFPGRVLENYNERRNEPRSLFGPTGSYIDDSISRIVKSVKAKRSQVRSSTSPVILALHGGNLGADAEDFDQALIGHSLGGHNGRGFHLDGELYRRLDSNKPPTYAGVLALLDVGVFGIKGWVYYPHPRFKDDLPTPFGQLPIRIFDQATQSVIQHAGQSPQEMNQSLNFAVT